MNIEVTKDFVKILERSETPHENEYKVTTCKFTFDDFTEQFQVKRAIFTILSSGEMYETDIINDECDIPIEVLKNEYETVKLGVYSFDIETIENDGKTEEILKQRTSPSYDTFVVPTGSYEEGALSPEPITPTQYDLYSQALQEGLEEVDDKLDEVVETVDNKLDEVDNKLEDVDDKIDEVDGKIEEVNTAITETNNLDLDVEKSGKVATVTLTKKDATEKVVTLSDGTNLMFNWQGTSLGIKTDEDEEYTYVDLQGVQGETGPMGAPFTIKKTYSSVAEMNADFNNMELGDYVMIASTVEIEDNAKLYTRGETQWIFITDFSGATGIQGPTGVTPNIQIGTVVSGDSPNVTRSGTNENPVLNFTLVKGDTGNTGATGPTGNGIASIQNTSTSGLIDTYTITYTNTDTSTFTVTNGNGIDRIELTNTSGTVKTYTIYYTNGNTTTFDVHDGEVTQEQLDDTNEEVERANMVYNALPKVSGSGTSITLNNTAECPIYDYNLGPTNLTQNTTIGKNLFDGIFELGIINGTTGQNASNDNYMRDKNYIPVEELTDYKFSTDNQSITAVLVYEYKADYSYNLSTNKSVNLTNYLTTNANTKYIRFRPSGQVTDLTTKFQVEKGTVATDWEEYTGGIPGPNPSYPQTVHTISGENSVKVENKNLFNIQDLVKGRLDNGVIGYETGTTSITLKARSFSFTTNANYRGVCTNSYIQLNPETIYNFNSDTSSGITVALDCYDENKTYLSRPTAILQQDGSRTFTTPANTKYGRIGISINTTGTINIENPQFEKSSTATTYVSYQEQTYPISLGDLKYCKIGDYEDMFFKNVQGSTYYDNTLELNKWYIKKKIDKVVYDENISVNITANNRFQTSVPYNAISGYSTTNFKCNTFSPMSASESATTTSNNIFVVSGNYAYFRMTDTTTEQELKSALSTNNAIVYYVMTNTIDNLLSNTLQSQLDNIYNAISYQEQTNVSQTNDDLPFVLSFTTIRDMSDIYNT